MINPFTARYPVAFHVFPLNRARALWSTERLLGKETLGSAMARRTTRSVDLSLGLGNVVHWYLAKSQEDFRALPILLAQTRPSRLPAIPHAVLELRTSDLAVDELRVCNWNLAVSRPAVAGVCRGGNWTRGTDPNKIAEVWRRFREADPEPRRARGFWKDGCLVPLLDGWEVVRNLPFLTKAAGGKPELILDSGFEISRCSQVLVFSERDRETLAIAGPAPGDLPVEIESLPHYGEESVGGWERRQIEHELQGMGTANLDFDAIRPANG